MDTQTNCDFAEIRKSGTGLNTVLSQHFIQIFASNEITSERALEIKKELCEKFLKALSEYEKIRRKVLEFYLSGHTFFCTVRYFQKVQTIFKMRNE